MLGSNAVYTAYVHNNFVDPVHRTRALDLNGNLLWSRDIYIDAGGDDDVSSEPLLALDAASNRLFVTRSTGNALALESLATADGSVHWSAPELGGVADGVTQVLALKYDSVGDRVLAIVDATVSLRISAFDAGSGSHLWTSSFGGSTGSLGQPPSAEIELTPDGLEAIVASQASSTFRTVEIYGVALSSGAVDLRNDSYTTFDYALALSPDGSRLALALGRAPSARVAVLDRATGQVQWLFKDELTTIGERPDVLFEPDGEHLLAGFMRLGGQLGQPLTPAARFLRFETASGQLLQSSEQSSGNSSLFNKAAGPSLQVLDATTHRRSFTLLDDQGGHFQRIERVENATGSILATRDFSGPAQGQLHLSELGSAGNQGWSVVQIQQGPIPSGLNPDLALSSWDLSLSAPEQLFDLPTNAFVPQSIALVGYDAETRRVAYVTIGTSTLKVIEADSGALLQDFQIDLDSVPFKALTNGSLLFPEDGDSLVLRTQSPQGDSGTDLLVVFDLPSESERWRRLLPTGSGGLIDDSPAANAGQRGVAVAQGRVLVSENKPGDVFGPPDLVCLDLADGSEQWRVEMTGAGTHPAPIAVAGGLLYAAQADSSTGLSVLSIAELDVATGSILREVPIGIDQYLLALSASDRGLAAITVRSDNILQQTFERRVWAFERFSLGLLDVREEFFYGLIPFRENLGFAALADGYIEQVGKQLEGPVLADPAPAGWAIEVDGLDLNHDVCLLDEGEAFAISDFGIPFSSVGGDSIRVFDSLSGVQLWSTSGEQASGGTSEAQHLIGSDRHEFHLLGGTTDPELTGQPSEVPAATWMRYELPDVLLSQGEVSLAGGGAVQLDLRGEVLPFGFDSPFHVVLGGQQIVQDGPQIGPFTLPFAANDPFLLAMLTPQPGVTSNFIGNLNVKGNGTATLTLPPGLDPALAGEDFFFAFAQLELSEFSQLYELTSISGVAPLLLVP